MTKAKAAAVAGALITAGYQVSASVDQVGEYTVRAATTDGSAIGASAVTTFATNNTVTGRVYSAEFV